MKTLIIKNVIPDSKGVLIQLNQPAKLKSSNSNLHSKEFWISWDKIGAELFENYTDAQSVDELNEIRNK